MSCCRAEQEKGLHVLLVHVCFFLGVLRFLIGDSKLIMLTVRVFLRMCGCLSLC